MRDLRSTPHRGIGNLNTYLLFLFLLTGISNASEVQGQQYVQLGDGTLVTGSQTPSPVNIYYRSTHGQVNYSKAELNAAGFYGGIISELGFYIEEVPSYSLPNYSIGMSTTTEGDTSSYNPGPFTIVYTNSSYTPTAGGFDMLTLDEPFYWDGISNILIDLCFDLVPNYTSTGRVRYYDADYGFRYTWSDGSSQCGVPTSSFTGEKPQLQLLVSGTAENDAGVSTLNAPIDFCAGSQDIVVQVSNFGTNIIDSVQVNWTFDNVSQTGILLTTPLDTFGGLGSQSASLTLGNKTFVNGSSYDLQVWTSMPNGVQDTVSINDTLMTVLQPSLNGTYTIGGISPDYTTISDAVVDLNAYGICGPVTFNIRNGFYNEQFSINQFSGSDCNLPVIFQSETGDSTGVVINDVTDVFSSNYIVELNGADGVTFSGLSFVGAGSYARTVYIRGGSNCNTFQNCVFEGSAVSSTSSNYILIASEANTSNYDNTFTNSVFKNGSAAFNLTGDYDGGPIEVELGFAANAVDPDSASLEISNNLFEGQYYRHIFLDYYGGTRIIDNIFNSNSTYSNWNSIYIDNAPGGVEVSGNQLTAIRGTGLRLSYSDGTTTQRNLFANNFISISGTDSSTRGIYVYSCANTDIYHNNINITTAQDQAVALYAAALTNMNVLNNCIVNTGGGYAVYYDGINNSLSDYNNYYQTGIYLGNYAGTLVNDLTAWQNANGLDANSISAIPFYLSDTDLHVATIDLNAAGTPVADVLYDIDGELRDVATPDIGADEFSPPPNDAGVLDIVAPGIPFPAGTYPVYAVLKNYGNDDLLSADLAWSINDSLQTVVNWTGTLSSGDTLSVLLGDVAIDNGQVYSLVSWSSLPNGVSDIINSNDTTDVVEIYAGLGGTYTLGGTSPDFTDFASVEDALNFGGVYAPVIINVRDGIYNEQIHLTEIIGADATNNVVFQSESGDSTGVIIEFSPDNINPYVWLLDGTDYLTIKGMTLRSLNTSYANVVVFQNEANNNTIEHNYFDGNGIYGYLIYSNTYLDENNIIKNNFFQDGRYAIYFAGNSSSDRESGNIISGNKLENQYRYGVYLLYQSGLIFENNQIGSFAENTTYGAVYLLYSNDAQQITGNTIISNSRNYGLQMEYCSGTLGNEGLIANNFITLLRTNSTANGIYTYSGTYQKYYNNTINIQSTDPNSSAALYTYYGGNIDLRNNIFSNKGGGYLIYINNSIPITSSDNNDFYTTGANVAYLTNTPVATLADWQTATGLDAASLSVDPFFESDSTYVVTQVSLNGAAQPLAEVTTDIEGEARDAATPDIGADEFVPAAVDAGVIALGVPEAPFAVGDQLVKATFKNFGTDTITTIVIDWELNGLAQAPINWTGMLASDDTLEVALDIVNFELAQAYNFKAWTSLPNTIADPAAVNDTSSINNIYAGLGGSYTLGGTTPDFANFTEAATVLNYGGVYAPVDIQVRDGVYSEKIELFEIPGADTLNQVTIESENDDPALVTLSSTTNSSTNYIIRLNGTDWLTVNGMTIQTLTNSTYARVILVENGANHNTFSNNHIISTSTTSTSTNRAVVYISPIGVNKYNGLVNNTISNGSIGLYLDGNYNNAVYTRGNYLTGNQFENQYYAGAFIQDYLSDVLVADNIITSNTSYTSYYGLYMDDLEENIYVLRNQILGVPGYGIFFRDVYSEQNSQSYVVNNFIQLNGTSTSYGIYSYQGSYQNIYHNTVSLTNTNADSRAFYQIYGSNKKIKNNIFSNTGGGYAYYSGSTYGIIESDYNNLYATGTYAGYWSGQQATLADWQTASSFDANSITLDPLFAAETDLHVSNVLMDKQGTPIPEVIDDIDGDTRDPQFPDMGADEFSTSNNDAGIYSIDSPNIPFAADNQPIYVTVINNGLDTLENADIDWQVNDEAQPPLSWTGMLLPGQQADSVLLGNYIFERDTLYGITAWTSNPNGVVDTETYNDTLQLNDLYAALSGVYTIGGTLPDYQNFTEAVIALERGGVVGEVTFDVRTGTYNEQLLITEIIGADAQNTITFQAETGDSTQVVLTFDGPTNTNNYVVQLDGADWIGFNQMTLQSNGSTSYERIISLINGADNNVFSNTVFTGRDVNTTSTSYAMVYSTGTTPNNNNTFINNHFTRGSYAIYYVNGNSTTPHTILISENTFEHQYYRAIYQRYTYNSEVSNNTITTDELYSSYDAIRLYNALGGNLVTQNTITDLPRGNGIVMYSSNGTLAEPNLISNNFIQTGTGNYSIRGIYNESSYFTNIYHNSVHVTSSSTSATALYIAYGNNTNIQNNILANTGGGYAIYNNTSNNISTSDYNNLFTTGTNIAAWNNSVLTDLSAWQTTSGMDANSLSTDPLFVSTTDLHIAEIDLDGAGTPLTEVTIDIDDEARDPATPDIGADEFNPATANDIGIEEVVTPSAQIPFPAQNQEVVVALKNNGIDTIYNAIISWSVNDNIQLPINWTGELFPGERDTIIVGDYNFELGIPHEIVAYTSQPNGLPDALQVNDTTRVDDIYAALSGVYTLGGNFVDFANFEQAANALSKGGVLGPVEFLVTDGTYNEQVNISTINGVDATNTVIFRSASGDPASVLLQHGSPYVVRLNGADYVTFENLSIDYTYYYSGSGVELINGANNNQFLNNIFTASSINGYSSAHIYSNSNSLDNNTRIIGNTFQQGNYGVRIHGQSSSSLESGTIIQDNIFTNQYYTGIDVYYQDSPQITGNLVTTDENYSSFIGIYARDTDNELNVSNNEIYASSGTGIYLYRCDGTPAAHALVSNNFVQVGGTNSANGIYLYYGNYTDVYYNSINLTNTAASSKGLYSYYGSNRNVVNNIFANPGGGYAIYATNSGFVSLDYNDLYTTGSILGYWNGTDATTLANWRQVSGRGINSVSLDPLYVSNTDLHITQTGLDSTGIFLPTIQEDIDGEVRDGYFPDIGADEFSTLPANVGVLSVINPISDCGLPSNDSLVVTIKNYGTLAQSGFDIAYQIGTDAPVIETVSGTVSVGGTLDYTFATPISFPADSTYEITTYTLLTNDQQLQNDTLEVQVTGYPAMTPMILTPGQTICQGESITLEAAGEGTFQWNGSYTNNQFYVTPSDTTTYTVLNTNQYGCTQEATIRIDVIPQPAIATISATGGSLLICSGDSVELVSSIAENILWSTGDTTQSIMASTQGYYYVDHYDTASDCYARSSSVYVNVYQEPYLYVDGFTSICDGDAATLIVYNGNGYQWSTGETTQSISVSPSVPTTYTVTMTNAGGCSQIDSIEITQVPAVPPGAVSSMLPADGTMNWAPPINFSWLPAANASDYDVYIWPLGNNRPSYPTFSNVNGINVSYSNLNYGATYNWQVVSENSCFSTDGPVQTFTVKDPSNLVVENIDMLAAPFSGQTTGISWEVNNIGIGATGVNSNWKDRVYLSIDSTLGASDLYLKQVDNISALMPGESYLNYASINLPEAAIGPYYFLVSANNNQAEVESDYSDNVTAIFVNIALSPPPDLEVTNTLPPGVNGYAFSGQTIPLTYTVSNNGIGLTPSPNWQDRIYWSEESTYNPTNLNYVGYHNHSGSLQPGESYTHTAEAELPENYSGTVYFYIVTDYNDAVFEHLDEDNNITRSQPLDILLTPPPDLEVSYGYVTDAFINDGTIDEINYMTTQLLTTTAHSVINDGGSIVDGYFVDSMFLSPVLALDSTAIPLRTRNRNIVLEINESDNAITQNIPVPNVPAGVYYLIIKTDARDNIYEGNNEGNNVYVNPTPINVSNPDLRIDSVLTFQDTIETGASINLYWWVNTQGPLVAYKPRKDKIYISESPVLDTMTATQLAEKNWNTNYFNDNGVYPLFETVNIPVEFVEGQHYIHIMTDQEDVIYELYENNNTETIPLYINVAPWADLVPQGFSTLPDSIFAGEPFPFGFTIKNNGIADADQASWKDRVYVSILDTWYPEIAVPLTDFERFQAVEKDSSYTVEAEISFPMLSLLVAGLDSFSYVYAYVFTDADSTIFEYNSENNNILRSDPIHVTCPPPVDMNILSATTSMPDTVAEGSTFTLGWNVQNQGSTTANWNYELWYDGLYLSTDMVYDEDDIFVYDWTESGPLAYNEIYDDYQSFTIPNGNYDSYYLLLVSDHTDLNNDGDPSNNVFVVNNLAGNNQIYVASTPKPDLEITALNIPSSGIAGQPITVSWTVQNNGDAAVEVPFTEQFKLDTNDDGVGGQSLGQYTKSDSLLVGESYTESMDVTIPISASGNYYIVMKTDATNQLFELDAGEDNNLAAAIIQIAPQTPSDLIVPAVSVGTNTEVLVGDTLSFDYLIKNIGSNPAEGVRKDIIYLSQDSLFNTNDPILATINYNETVLPYQELTDSIDVAIPGVTPGEYFVIVSADGFNNILETDETNNTTASVNKINVVLPELVIDIPENTVLTDDEYQYYELVVPDSLAGETLVITLESDEGVGNNELYLKYEESPTLSNADYTYAIPFSTYQELIVETLQAGTYYLLVKGTTQPNDEQNITLLAEILPFEIRAIDAEQGGNTGNVTIRIDGAKFEPNMAARLEGSMNVTAINTYFINSTRIFATFDLNGADLGLYDVIVDKGLEEATLTEGFEVVVGSFGTSEDTGNGSPGFFCDISYNEGVSNFLDQDLDYPSAVRRNRTVEINIYFRNDGNIDIPIPARFLLSVSGHPVSADVAGLDDEGQELFLEFTEDGGPPGILRAGASGLVRAYTRSFSSGTVIELILAE